VCLGLEAVAGAGEHVKQRAAAQAVAAQDHHVCHSVCVCVCVCATFGFGVEGQDYLAAARMCS
jgi:hypothetical protein